MFVIKIMYFKNPERQTVLLVLITPFKSLSNYTETYTVLTLNLLLKITLGL